MGFEQRDYYYRENEGGGGFALTGGLGTACKALIAINAVVFLLQILSTSGNSSDLTQWFMFDAGQILQGQVWRLATWGFGYSGNPLGFLFDMLFIWWFGKQVETMYGTKELFLYYGAAILLASGVALAAHFIARVPIGMMGSAAPSMAVTVLFAWHFPYRQILLFFLIPVPIFAVVAFYVVMSLFAGSQAGFGNGPVLAGLTAVGFGLLYGWRQWRIEPLIPGKGFEGFKFSLPSRKPDLRVYEPEKENEDDREVDRILAKIHAEGEGSLTNKERKTLQKASRRYRK